MRSVQWLIMACCFMGCSQSPSGALPTVPKDLQAPPSAGNTGQPKPRPVESSSFDFSFSLPDLNGNTISLDDYKGKVVIVDFWGTWCPPCRNEIPHFISLHRKYHDTGLEIVGINYENGPREKWTETIKAFVETNGIPYSCVLGDKATQDMVPNLIGFPTTLFIDRTGRVRRKLEGEHSEAAMEVIVNTLLAEAAPNPASN
jgi:thiol-disulfide isomerase/thioredoxin